MAHEIDELKRLLGQSAMTKSDVAFFMSQVRNLLESRNLKSKYSVLNFYCNWTFHTKIDQSMVCFRMLERLTENILAHKDSPPNSAFFTAVSATVAVPTLRDELNAFCSEVGVPDTVCHNDQVWKTFFSMVAAILVDRPIQFPDVSKMKPKVKAIYDSICSKVGSKSFGVKGFLFYVKEPNGSHDSGELWWKVDLIPSATTIPNSVGLCGKFSWVV